MQKKDILGHEWMSNSFLFSSSMKVLDGEYEGYSSLLEFSSGSRDFTLMTVVKNSVYLAKDINGLHISQ